MTLLLVLLVAVLCSSPDAFPDGTNHGHGSLILEQIEQNFTDEATATTELSIKFQTRKQTQNGTNSANEDPQIWGDRARKFIKKKLNQPRIQTRAKNLILMIGDGMGLSTVTASRILKGQRKGLLGEDGELYMETFPYVGTSKTFCNDVQVADSACSATAYCCGVKGNIKTIGVNANVRYRNCSESMRTENQVESVLAWAQSRGMSTGIVTTTAITDASPAGSYAHVADREWENDAEVTKAGYNPVTCLDIAKQLIQESPGKGINVILGGGRGHFIPNTDFATEHATKVGNRLDGRHLIQDWLQHKRRATYVSSRQKLLKVDLEKTEFLLGLFAFGNLEYTDKMAKAHDPTLTEMTEVAVKILSKNPKGFYLFVEGGNIDVAHHVNNAQRALVETLEFDKAIQKVDDLTQDDQTLIVVSADHSHLLTIAGTPPRGNSIFEFTGKNDTGDGRRATTLSYVNGPGFRPFVYNGSTCVRADLTTENTDEVNYKQMAAYYRSSATHAGEDVLIFAKGPFAHLFTGVNDQTFIAHAMKHAALSGAKSAYSITPVLVFSVLTFIVSM